MSICYMSKTEAHDKYEIKAGKERRRVKDLSYMDRPFPRLVINYASSCSS
jgi:hypothetical protein